MAYQNDPGEVLSKLNLGFEYFDEDYEWQTIRNFTDTLLSDNEEVRRYYNIFGQADLSLSSRSTLILGLNYNSTRYDYTDLFLEDLDDASI